MFVGVQSSGSRWRGRRERGEINNGTGDDGFEVARISVSTGTQGGAESVTSDDDPADRQACIYTAYAGWAKKAGTQTRVHNSVKS